ncbi:MAG: sensor histidine kinase [Planctomycetota bacterium]|nr:MAG: sensor histidine kinase [Planctomycetota bacterium]
MADTTRRTTMKDLQRIRSSLRGPVTLFVLALVLMVALLVLWNIALVSDYQQIRELAARAEDSGTTFHYTYIIVGSILFVTMISVTSVLGAQLLGEIRFTQRLADFVATFTHELNSPLASIKLFAQTLRRGELPRAEQERFLDLILADVERLSAQISNVLRAAQVDGPEGLRIAPEPVDLFAFLRDFVAARRAAVEKLKEDVDVSLSDGPAATGRPTVGLDRQLFRQALDNLVDNSLKYRRQDTPLRVEIAICPAPAGWVGLEVRDNGRGIRAGDLRRVFDRFQRLEERSDSPRQAGTGLGLWIVRAIVDAHGGHVEARSAGEGQGTTIRIELPELPPPPDPDAVYLPAEETAA